MNDEKKLLVVASQDLELARVESEKNLSFIKAWEDSEKTKADNK